MKIVKYRGGNVCYHLNIKQFKATASTAGNGLWSYESRKITHSRAELCLWGDQIYDYINRNQQIKFAELRVYFPKKNWDVKKHGLIYTDRQWIKEFKKSLVKVGFSQKSVSPIYYTEQGMQGDNYVSIYVTSAFIKQIFKLNAQDFQKICRLESSS